MKKTILLAMCVATTLNVISQKKPIDYVNPIVGTKSMGHTFPGACAPFGLVQLSPEIQPQCNGGSVEPIRQTNLLSC